MKKAKHTPGPWAVSKGYDGSISVSATRPYRINKISAGTPIICDVYQHPEFDSFSGAANARLIAAAPENLQSNSELATIVRELCVAYEHPLPEDALARSDAAIAKATGRADSGQAAQGDRHE